MDHVRFAVVCLSMGLLGLACNDEVEAEFDFDGDGVDDKDDCAPEDPAVYPGATDYYGDGVDTDCDECQLVEEAAEGAGDGVDADCDGYPANVDPDAEEYDCNDNDAGIHPGAVDEPNNGFDEDCDGFECEDEDGDDHCEGLDDCDDDDPEVYWGATEVADCKDNDCDQDVDEGTATYDNDGDGACVGEDLGQGLQCCDGSETGDCDDDDSELNVQDVDSDGWHTCAGDCMDADPSIHPGMDEVCDLVDNDCDGTTEPFDESDVDGDGDPACSDCDDGDAAVSDLDADGDGTSSCEGDCDDTNDNYGPEATDLVGDGLDHNCDGLDGVDADGDGFAADWSGGDDCDDADPAMNSEDGDGDGASPCGADGVAGTADDDCDDGDDQLNIQDLDADGWTTCAGDCDDGDDGLELDDIDLDGWTTCDGDCDDSQSVVYPGAVEHCDALDNDCDGQLGPDETDDDGDGNGECQGDCDDTDPTLNIDDDDGDWWSTCSGDCDDSDPSVHPYAVEDCDGRADNDCDGVEDPLELDDDADGASECDGDCDDTDAMLNVADVDGDAFTTCDGDCDDADPATQPWAAELCDGVDNDCDAIVPADEVDLDGDGWFECQGDCDDGDAALHPEDLDGDGASPCDGDCDDGDADLNIEDGDGDTWDTCEGDCDDEDNTVYPTAPDPVNGVDDNCDGFDGADGDGDGYASWADGGDDCDDLDPDVHPGAAEACNGFDDDCDGVVPADENDDDGDGYRACEDDCDDDDGDLTPADLDGDGYSTCDADCDDGDYDLHPADWDGDGLDACDDEDCDDGDAAVFPHQIEIPHDGLDQDCDGLDHCVDLDCDGYTDLVFANFTNGAYALDSYIYWGSESGYSESDRTGLPTVGAWDAVIGDVDGDGYLDLLFTSFWDAPADYDTTSYLYWGSASGYSTGNRDSFATHSAAGAEMADLDEDGYLDVAIASYGYGGGFERDSYIYWGSASGYSSSDRTALPTQAGFRPAIADLDADGDWDVAFANHNDDAYDYELDSWIYWGSGFSQYNRQGLETEGASAVVAQDLDGNGYDDLLFVGHYNGASFELFSYLWWGSASGYSTLNRTALSSYGGSDADFGDLDSDGYEDILIVNNGDFADYTTDSYIYWGSATGYSLYDVSTLNNDGAWGGIVEDLDGDGFDDIVFACSTDANGLPSTDSVIWWGTANGPSIAERTYLATEGSRNVAAAGPGIEVPRAD
jgi:hypothetical protein